MRIFKRIYDKLLDLISYYEWDYDPITTIKQFDQWSYTNTIKTIKSVGSSNNTIIKNFAAELVYKEGILTNFKLVPIERWYDPSCIPAIISYVMYDNEEVIKHTIRHGDSISLAIHKYTAELKVKGCYIPVLYGDDQFFCVFNNDQQYIAAPIPKRLIKQSRKHFETNGLENLVDGVEYVERPTDYDEASRSIIGSIRTPESINSDSTGNNRNDNSFEEFRKEFFGQFGQFGQFTRQTSRKTEA